MPTQRKVACFHEKRLSLLLRQEISWESCVVFFDYVFRCDRFPSHTFILVEIANSSIFEESGCQ